MDADFTKATVELIAKRAANICTNPDCGVHTTGPSEEPDKAITIGEAAHIYAARAGSARFNEAMTDAERSAITNAIWLCRNCHKLIDADASAYPAEILFEWRRHHDSEISQKLGKASELIRQRVLARQLEGFAQVSYLAQQIVIDKPPFWEQRLTAELLRSGLKPILMSWRALDRGLYAEQSQIVPLDQMFAWNRARMAESSKQATALAKIVNDEIIPSWGPPGTPGEPADILRVCNLFIGACRSLLRWEEIVRFAALPSEFDEFQRELSGTAGHILETVAVLPQKLGEIFDQKEPSGTHAISIVFDLPEGWVERVTKSFRSGVEAANR